MCVLFHLNKSEDISSSDVRIQVNSELRQRVTFELLCLEHRHSFDVYWYTLL